MSCAQALSYSSLLGSCVTMLLSACAYIITHTVSSDTKSGSDKETRKKRDEQSMTKQEDVFFPGQSQPNRTGSRVEREVVKDETQRGREEEDPVAELGNEAAVVRNGDITKAMSDSKPVIKAKVCPYLDTCKLLFGS